MGTIKIIWKQPLYFLPAVEVKRESPCLRPTSKQAARKPWHLLPEDRRLSAEDRRLSAEDCRLLAEDRRLSAEDRRLLPDERRLLADPQPMRVEDSGGLADIRGTSGNIHQPAAEDCRSSTLSTPPSTNNRQPSAHTPAMSPEVCRPSAHMGRMTVQNSRSAVENRSPRTQSRQTTM